MKTTFKTCLFLAFITLFAGCEKGFLPEPENNPEAIFEELWTSFDQLYAPFEERQVNWEAQYLQYRSQVDANTSDDELFTILSNMLASLDDGHVRLIAPNRDVFFSNHIRQNQIDDSLFNLSVVMDNYLEEGYVVGEELSYVYGKTKEQNIGYIYFEYVGPNFMALTDFLNDFSDVEGIIIDLRHNTGGDFTYAFTSLGRFTNKKRFVFKSKTKNGTGKNNYTSWHEWYITPNGEYVDKPVVVLIDRYTISAGERAVMALRTLPNVTFIGDTTNGAHSTMIGRELVNGWYYSLVTQKTRLSDGQSYEGSGLAPDFYVKNEFSDVLSGKDEVLERAIEQ